MRLPAAPLCPPAELSAAENRPDEQNDEQREGHEWQGGMKQFRGCVCVDAENLRAACSDRTLVKRAVVRKQ